MLHKKNYQQLAFSTLLVLIGCQFHQHRYLYTYPSDIDVLHKFPHNCLEYKTTIDDVEKSHKNFQDKDVDWKKFKELMNPDDELWYWRGDRAVPNHESDPRASSKGGYCLIRKNKVMVIFYCEYVVVT